MRRIFLCAVLVAFSAWPAGAQVRGRRAAPPLNPRVFLSLNLGIQPVTDEPADRFTFEQDLETATVDVNYGFERATMFDGGVAVRLWKRLGAGVAVSKMSLDAGTAAVDARIPHPFFFEQPRTVTGDVDDVQRSETAVHVQLVYIVPTRGRLRMLLSAGPSRMAAEQDIVTAVHYDESYPFDTATYRSATKRAFSGSAIGIHAGADVSYRLTRTIGAGGTLRFSRADLDLEGPDNRRISLEAGGLQVAGGIRVVF